MFAFIEFSSDLDPFLKANELSFSWNRASSSGHSSSCTQADTSFSENKLAATVTTPAPEPYLLKAAMSLQTPTWQVGAV
jgi:hypothetical protein